MVAIELTDKQTEEVIVSELIHAFELTAESYEDDEEYNSNLREAIKVILKHYMNPIDYEHWSLT